MRVKLTLEYDGSAYSGWQLQKSQNTVQAQIEAALKQIFSTDIRIYGSGRTDAGVHARGQVAMCDLPRPFEISELKRALNAIMPSDIAVLDAVEADDSFDPRRDARLRIYEYRVLNRDQRSAFEYRYSWLVRDRLDLDAMNRAAQFFVGDHDFAGFRTLGSEEKTTIRRVDFSQWRREEDLVIYRVEATAFLRHMVRTMVATMVEVGRGKVPPEFVATLLQSGDRSLAPASAPASGLFLIEVRY